MRLVDLHCDTLYKAVKNQISINDKSLDVSICRDGVFSNKLQCYAIWIPDNYNGDSAEKLFLAAHKKLNDECRKNNIYLINKTEKLKDKFYSHEHTAFFTVENSTALNGKIDNVKKFADMGVRMMTLTWNAHNDVGDGADVAEPYGITEFGKKVLCEMEKYGIAVDISHASDKLFYDVAELTLKPFAASHSNSRKITNHRRNLTDEQFKIIIDRNGLVGINFNRDFLSEKPESASKYDILRHVDHFLSLGGESCICFGSDFDGCYLPDDIEGSRTMYDIYNMFLAHNYPESTVNGIFFKNALKFFENFDI